MNPLFKREKIKIDGDAKHFIRQNEYRENLADFRTFFIKNQDSLIKAKKMPVFTLFGNKAAAWAVSAALVILIAGGTSFYFLGINPLIRLQKGGAFVVTAVNGNVMLKKKGAGGWSVMKIKDFVSDGDKLKTDKDGSCELQMINKGIYRVDKTASVSVSISRKEKGAGDVRLFLDSGRILLNPRPLLKGESFAVITPALSAGVKGTKFSVEIESNGDNRIAVSEGRVLVSAALSSIGSLEAKGLLDKAAADKLRDQFAAPVMITSNEAAVFKKDAGDLLETAIKNVIENGYKKYSRPIGVQDLGMAAAGEKKPRGVIDSIRTGYQEALKSSPVFKKGGVPESLIEKKSVSPADLGELNSLKISGTIKNVLDMAEITIVSEPPDADVYINGFFAGRTPVKRLLEKGGVISLKISKEGYSGYNKPDFTVPGSFTVNPGLRKIVSFKAGEIVWKRNLALNNPEKEAVLYNGRLIIPDGNLLKIASAEGEILKTIRVVDEKYMITKPVVDGGVVYAGSDFGGLYAYSVSGEPVWKNLSAGKALYNAAPVSQNGLIVLPTFDKGIQVFDSKGKMLFTIAVENGEAVYSTPIIIKNGSVLIYGTETGNIGAYDLKNKKPVWVKSIFNDRVVYPIIGNDGAVYALSREEGKIVCLDPVDGSVIWTNQFDSVKKTSLQPLFSKDRLLLFTNNEDRNSVIILDGKSGKTIQKLDFADRLVFPCLSGDHLFIGTESGRIFDYNLPSMHREWLYDTGAPVSLVAADDSGVYALSRNSMIKIAR